MEVRHAQGSVSKWQTFKEKVKEVKETFKETAKEVVKEGVGKTIAGKLGAKKTTTKESKDSTQMMNGGMTLVGGSKSRLLCDNIRDNKSRQAADKFVKLDSSLTVPLPDYKYTPFLEHEYSEDSSLTVPLLLDYAVADEASELLESDDNGVPQSDEEYKKYFSDAKGGIKKAKNGFNLTKREGDIKTQFAKVNLDYKGASAKRVGLEALCPNLMQLVEDSYIKGLEVGFKNYLKKNFDLVGHVKSFIDSIKKLKKVLESYKSGETETGKKVTGKDIYIQSLNFMSAALTILGDVTVNLNTSVDKGQNLVADGMKGTLPQQGVNFIQSKMVGSKDAPKIGVGADFSNVFNLVANFIEILKIDADGYSNPDKVNGKDVGQDIKDLSNKDKGKFSGVAKTKATLDIVANVLRLFSGFEDVEASIQMLKRSADATNIDDQNFDLNTTTKKLKEEKQTLLVSVADLRTKREALSQNKYLINQFNGLQDDHLKGYNDQLKEYDAQLKKQDDRLKGYYDQLKLEDDQFKKQDGQLKEDLTDADDVRLQEIGIEMEIIADSRIAIDKMRKEIANEKEYIEAGILNEADVEDQIKGLEDQIKGLEDQIKGLDDIINAKNAKDVGIMYIAKYGSSLVINITNIVGKLGLPPVVTSLINKVFTLIPEMLNFYLINKDSDEK